MNNPGFDNMYFENPSNRSPTSQRSNTLHRQTSRNQFESYGHLPSGLYTAEDHAANRYDGNRFGDMRNTLGGYGSSYDMGGQTWNGGHFGGNGTLNGLAGGSLRKPPSRGGRSALPNGWMDQNASMPMGAPPSNMGFGAMHRQETMMSEPDEELIPTAIVIKNIPFAIKKEQLVDMMTGMGLPLPYAFNYHFDNGVFRGLAFANFTNPDETGAVIAAMNHLELHGRKLRVEYKKMLPAAERERIEREKRERRGQLEEQHRPTMPSQAASLQTQGSLSSLSSRMQAHSPSPVSSRNPMGVEVDMNDPLVLRYYSQLLLFKEDHARDLLVLPPSLSPQERRTVHTLAHHMGLGHASKGESDRRAVHVFKEIRARVSPPMQQIGNLRNDERRGLNRAATTDFTDVRGDPTYHASTLRHQGSGTYLSTYHEPAGLGPGSALRNAKSFADLRSWTPSPVPSTASFPTALGNNMPRLQEFGGRDSAQSNPPSLMGPPSVMSDRSETQIINGLGGMNLGAGNLVGGNLGGGFGGSPRGLRGLPSWDREAPGPIGGHRNFTTAFDERGALRSTVGPERQPRGPLPERGAGFPRPRQNGHVSRNSDELSQQSSPPEIAVEH